MSIRVLCICRLPVAVAAVLLTAYVSCLIAQEPEPMTDNMRLRGLWKLVEVTNKGESKDATDDELKCDFEEDLVKIRKGEKTKTVRYRLDDKTSPKQLDLSAYAVDQEEHMVKDLGSPKE